MTEQTKQNGETGAAEYLDLYNQIKSMAADRDVALVILQEIAKDLRTNQIRQEKQQRAQGPATSRQKAYLDRLGVDFDANITSAQASQLIDEAREREG